MPFFDMPEGVCDDLKIDLRFSVLTVDKHLLAQRPRRKITKSNAEVAMYTEKEQERSKKALESVRYCTNMRYLSIPIIDDILLQVLDHTDAASSKRSSKWRQKNRNAEKQKAHGQMLEREASSTPIPTPPITTPAGNNV